jgi:hypothetical protein
MRSSFRVRPEHTVVHMSGAPIRSERPVVASVLRGPLRPTRQPSPADGTERVGPPSPSLFGPHDDQKVREQSDSPSYHKLDDVRPGRKVSADRASGCTHRGAEKRADERHPDGTQGYSDATQCCERQR